MKNRLPTKPKNVNFRTTISDYKRLKTIAKIMKISQSDVISIALLELEDLIKIYPEIDYRPDLGGWLLRKGLKDYPDAD
jgi:hypothetical protein